MKTINLLFAGLAPVVLFSGSCTETIDLELKTNAKRMVVDGILSNEQQVKIVRLSISVPYFTETESPPVTGAKVSITEGENVFNLIEYKDHKGYYYISSGDFMPKPGKSYTLKVENIDINSDGIFETYTATSEMPQVVIADSIDLKYQYFNKDWEIYQVLLYFQDPPATKNNYMYRLRLNHNRVTSKPSDIRISNDKFFDGNYVKGGWAQSIDAREKSKLIEKGDIITLELASITQDFYEFMDAVKKNEQGNDPLFSGPPANTPGNISNGALGFFTVVATSTTSVIYDPDKHD